MLYTVGEVARIANVSVRTLHHYDEIGVVQPSARSAAGYRLYSDADLARLQQVLFYRELEVPLGEVARIVNDAGFDRLTALRAQRESLAVREARTRALLKTLDRTIATMETGETMDRDEMFEVFGDFDPAEYEAEAEERWGDSEAYRESARRAAGYTKADWVRFKAESEEISGTVISLMTEGVPPDDPRVMDEAERLRRQIDTWFYPCSHRMHAALGEMYVADPRFTATYERIAPGLARYLSEAIRANAARSR